MAVTFMCIGTMFPHLTAATLANATVAGFDFPLNWIGWIATAVFVASYFAKSAVRLRTIQAAAALLWILYGMVIGALPVIVANAIVAVAAVYSSLRQRNRSMRDGVVAARR